MIVSETLSGFGGTVRSARAAYVRAVKGVREEAWAGESIHRLRWWKKDHDEEIQVVDVGPYVDVQGRSTGLERPTLSPFEFLQVAAELLVADLDELAGRGRSPETVHQRELLAVLGVERYGVPVKELAELLGKKRVTVSSWVRRGAEKRAALASFRDEIEALDRRIVDG